MNIDTSSKLSAGALALGLLVAACSGGDSGSSVVAVNTDAASDPPAATGSADNAETDEQPAASSSQASEPSQNQSEVPAEGSADEPRGENQLPDVLMIDIISGDEVTLASFAPSDRPIVLWFWAPH